MTGPLAELVDPGWADALAPVEHVVAGLGERLRAEVAEGRPYLPAGDAVLRAFRRPLHDVRVLVVGQDPYPTPGHSIGLAFAVERHVRPLPRSLANIYRELHDDLGIPPASHGDLSTWADQGVLLLNRVLTVQAGVTDSHRGWGWEQVTEEAIRALVARRSADGGAVPLVAILWGAKAQALAPLLDGVPTIASAHPSPLSARRGFFGSRPFSRANAALAAQGARPIDWRVPDADALPLDPSA
ncbi:uracil-DNA glycosylase [Agrococcus sp. HG114]|uniref:uracil-DNA glycosylase n=1 Tax=Agrococcus sp. HG114 TaxID=2969757 RepID=UPI00215B6FF4|nr:uracil-DNA glycosylase [Agrococcus sp. HG114]MCR8670814.1 uracil-DNA glycosylase [Agrococcus sp. HG114]